MHGPCATSIVLVILISACTDQTADTMEAQDYSFNSWCQSHSHQRRGSGVGYYFERTPYLDAEDGNKRKYKLRFHAIDFAPLNAEPNTTFEDSKFD